MREVAAGQEAPDPRDDSGKRDDSGGRDGLAERGRSGKQSGSGKQGRPRRKSFAEMGPQEQESAVRDRCLRLLSAQPRTRAQLERSLARDGAPEQVVAAVLDRFTGVGLIDDEAYAQAFLRTGVEVRRRGTRSLRSELRQRGVAADVIEAATAEIDADAERATALALASRRAAGWTRLEPQVRRRRLTGLLLRRGFSGAVVSSVLSEVLEMRADELGGDDGMGEPVFADVDDLSAENAGDVYGGALS